MFEKKLSNLIHNMIKLSFDPIKDISFDGLGKKKQCLRVLI